MMRKNRAVLAMAALCLLTGCRGGEAGKGLGESFTGMDMISITQEASVYVGKDRLLHMYDAARKADLVLCNKADCIHEPYEESQNPDPVCNAALNKELFGICIPVTAEDSLYLFGAADLTRGVVYRENLDGSGRTRVRTMDYQIEPGGGAYVRDKVAYVEASIPIRKEDDMGGAGTNSSYKRLVRLDLETGETKELSPASEEKFQGVDLLEQKGNKLYHMFYIRKPGGQEAGATPGRYAIYEYDMATGKQRTVFTEEEMGGLMPMGVTEEAVCAMDEKTGYAYEISRKDKSRRCVYKPPEKDVMYFVHDGKWIVGGMGREQMFHLKEGKLKEMPGIIAFTDVFGDFAIYYRQGGVCQAAYGGTLFADNRNIVMERRESA